MIQKEVLQQKLAKYDQSHLLRFFNQLTPVEQNELVQDIESVDFENVCAAFKQSDPRNVSSSESIDQFLEPLTADTHQSLARTSSDELKKYRELGMDIFCVLERVSSANHSNHFRIETHL